MASVLSERLAMGKRYNMKPAGIYKNSLLAIEFK